MRTKNVNFIEFSIIGNYFLHILINSQVLAVANICHFRKIVQQLFVYGLRNACNLLSKLNSGYCHGSKIFAENS